MTEAEWLTSDDPRAMLGYLQSGYEGQREYSANSVHCSDRKLRLFAVACCRAVWDGIVCPQCQERINNGSQEWFLACGFQCTACHGSGRVGGLTDPRSRRAVEVAERFADGMATEKERLAADREADDAVPTYNDTASPQWIAQASVGLTSANELAWEVVRRPLEWLPPATQADLLRDIFGNPFRSPRLPAACRRCGRPVDWSQRYERWYCPKCAEYGVEFSYPWLAWNDGVIPKLARSMYDARDFHQMPLLADALEQAGCEDAEILNHCRSVCSVCNGGQVEYPVGDQWETGDLDPCGHCKGTGANMHVRGCWVVDLILGKE